MKVYLVWRDPGPYEGVDLVSVHSARGSAEKVANDLEEPPGPTRQLFTVEEIEVLP